MPVFFGLYNHNHLTVPGAVSAEAGSGEMRADDISLFFSRLPPGIAGTPKQVYGNGSGSMVMAAQIQRAVSRRSPLLLIDGDRSASNLLVPCSTQHAGVIPLSTTIRENRERLGGWRSSLQQERWTFSPPMPTGSSHSMVTRCASLIVHGSEPG